jgi:hypothetical protein
MSLSVKYAPTFGVALTQARIFWEPIEGGSGDIQSHVTWGDDLQFGNSPKGLTVTFEAVQVTCFGHELIKLVVTDVTKWAITEGHTPMLRLQSHPRRFSRVPLSKIAKKG